MMFATWTQTPTAFPRLPSYPGNHLLFIPARQAPIANFFNSSARRSTYRPAVRGYRAARAPIRARRRGRRSEEHTSELQSLMRISYAVFCLKQKTDTNIETNQGRTS